MWPGVPGAPRAHELRSHQQERGHTRQQERGIALTPQTAHLHLRTVLPNHGLRSGRGGRVGVGNLGGFRVGPDGNTVTELGNSESNWKMPLCSWLARAAPSELREHRSISQEPEDNGIYRL